MTRFALGCVALLLFGACDGDEEGSGTAGSTGLASTTTTDPSGSGSTTTDPGTTTGSSSGGAEESSSGGSAGSSSTGAEGSSSTGNTNACDPPVIGEYNACVDENGGTDNTQCNYMGTGASVGTVGCLNGPTEGSNVCMIRDCVDDCDCFSPPATGDAPSVCRETLKGGGTACVLACDEGQTCPDGMTCDGGLCFHIPA